MTTLADNAIRKYELGDENHVPAIASDIIYEGAAVGDDGNGYGRPLEAGDPFRGFALRKCDNSGGSAGDKRIRVRRYGDIQLAISSLAIDDVGKDVYASDDNTFTLTQSTNTRIGYVKRWVSTGIGIIAFRENTSDVAELTDSSTGSADGEVDPVADIALDTGNTYSDAAVNAAVNAAVATVNDNMAEFAVKLNEVIRTLGR